MAMTLAEFDGLVEGSRESSSLDFKTACSWHVKTMARDILAFSNLQGGGFIVFGIDDETFERRGLTEEQVKTFDLEKMQDQMAEYADPFVTFDLHKNIIDDEGRRFVVIHISEFIEVPVVCKKEAHDSLQNLLLRKGGLYYRTKNRRPESAEVSNSYDMRDILDRAAIKMMTKRKKQGFTAVSAEQTNYYENELGGL